MRQNPDDPLQVSPVIPTGYNRIAKWQARTYGVTREQLAMCAVLMSEQARHHPESLNYQKTSLTLEQVLASPRVASMTNLFECARRTDGGAACVLASDAYLKRHGLLKKEAVRVVSGAEGSGPIYPPAIIDETMFSCEEAMAVAYAKAGLATSDIDFFGLYDCFPVCLLRSIEACGLAPRGGGGAFVERVYHDYVKHERIDPQLFPVNTHGGLLSVSGELESASIRRPITWALIVWCTLGSARVLQHSGGLQAADPRSGLPPDSKRKARARVRKRRNLFRQRSGDFVAPMMNDV